MSEKKNKYLQVILSWLFVGHSLVVGYSANREKVADFV
jgi:hypothetical protein